MNKKNNIIDAVKIWTWNDGFKEDENAKTGADLTVKKDGQQICFITDFDKTKAELLKTIKKVNNGYVYVVTDDNANRRKLIKYIPKHCGILCYSNPFGFGFIYQVLKNPELIA